MQNRIICPACDTFEKKDSFIVEGYNIKRCFSCGTLYVQNLPSSETLSAIYSSDTYYDLSTDALARIISENKRRISLIRKMNPSGTFLDIGCAQGLLLDQAKIAGYATFGVEPTSKNADVAGTKGHKVFKGGLKEFVENLGDQRFDVITCLDVIEHIEDPKAFMKLASSLLNNNGLLVVSTPNYSGLIAKILGSRDPYMTPPEHINFFTSNGMRYLAERCNLSIRLYKCFGSLIPAEMDRSIKRYIPAVFIFLIPIIRPSVHVAFSMMNLLKLGLEQEIYFNKKIKN